MKGPDVSHASIFLHDSFIFNTQLVGDTPSKPLTDKVSVCYQTESELRAFASAGADGQGSDQDSQKLIINFADVMVAEGEDFYAHVLASTFSFLQSQLLFSCAPIEENFAKIEIAARVVLQSVSEDQIVIEAKPSSEIQLRLDFGHTALGGTFDGVVYEFLAQESTRSGNFYFHDVPAGLYRLSFELDLSALANSTCLDVGNYYVYDNSVAEAIVGDRLFTWEKIKLEEQAECQTTVGPNRRLKVSTPSLFRTQAHILCHLTRYAFFASPYF
jgi:hypothetical protein